MTLQVCRKREISQACFECSPKRCGRRGGTSVPVPFLCTHIVSLPRQAQRRLHNGKQPLSRDGPPGISHHILRRSNLGFPGSKLSAASANDSFPRRCHFVVRLLFKACQKPLGNLGARSARETQRFYTDFLCSRTHVLCLSLSVTTFAMEPKPRGLSRRILSWLMRLSPSTFTLNFSTWAVAAGG